MGDSQQETSGNGAGNKSSARYNPSSSSPRTDSSSTLPPERRDESRREREDESRRREDESRRREDESRRREDESRRESGKKTGGIEVKEGMFLDFQSAWMARFPGCELPSAWEEDVRSNLMKHRKQVDILREELEKESFYVEYLEKLLIDVEKVRKGSTSSLSSINSKSSINGSDLNRTGVDRTGTGVDRTGTGVDRTGQEWTGQESCHPMETKVYHYHLV